jgi:hypothetical protein
MNELRTEQRVRVEVQLADLVDDDRATTQPSAVCNRLNKKAGTAIPP